jgi:putative ABC transport system permease protein
MRNNLMVTIFNLVGFTLCFFSISLIVGYVYPELTVDNYHKNKDRIFVVSPYSDRTWVANILVDIMKDRSAFDRVIPYGFDNNKSYMRNGENQPIESEALFVDSSFFDAFSFKFIAGDTKNCMNVPFSIVLTQSEAKRFFANEDPLGKKLKYNATHEVTVTGIIEDYPVNSIFRSKSFHLIFKPEDTDTLYIQVRVGLQ